jgi:hypothetical protein
MQKEDFKAVFDHVFGIVEGVVASGDIVHPVVLGVKMAPDHSIESLHVLDVSDLMAGPQGKDVLAQAMFKFVELPAVDIVAHVSEAWYLVKSTEDKIDRTVTISTEPDRKEGVMVLLMSKDSEVLSVNPIHRHPVPSLERGSLDFTQHLEGRFVREQNITH